MFSHFQLLIQFQRQTLKIVDKQTCKHVLIYSNSTLLFFRYGCRQAYIHLQQCIKVLDQQHLLVNILNKLKIVSEKIEKLSDISAQFTTFSSAHESWLGFTKSMSAFPEAFLLQVCLLHERQKTKNTLTQGPFFFGANTHKQI